MKTQLNYKISKIIYVVLLLTLIIQLPSCKKDVLQQQLSPSGETTPSTYKPMSMTSSNPSNPYSVINIKKALDSLGRSGEVLNPDRIWYYYQFDPNTVGTETMRLISANTEKLIQDFPFANASLFATEFSQTSWTTEKENLKDGNLYITFKANSPLASLFSNTSLISATKMDELYLPNADDHDLQQQAIANAQGITIEALRISLPCLLKRPRGFIRHHDWELNTLRGVPHIQVWALVFGIPVWDEADANGYYEIPWLFSAGTLMGIHAENNRVHVKPLNTLGSQVGSVLNVVTNFVMGATKDFGWYSACDMRNDINRHYEGHTQERYWSEILDAVHQHHNYTAQDNIFSAPNQLVWYAHWDEDGGAASAPMLGHFNTSNITQQSFLSLVLGINLNPTSQNLFNTLFGLLPDITSRISDNENLYVDAGDNHYFEGFMQTAFHELGHASLYQQVGSTYWTGVIANILIANTSACNGYGCGTETFWGLTQCNESWAEFIGKEHHRRFHPNGQAWVRRTGNANHSWENYPEALEEVRWFTNNWINTGIYWDVMDNNSANEPNDLIQGFTIRQMYECFNPTTEGLCDWRDEFLQRQPTVTLPNLNQLMINQNSWNNTCGNQWPGPLVDIPWRMEMGPLLRDIAWGR